MAVFKKKITLRSHGGTPTFLNITPQVTDAISESGIRSGIVTVLTPHTTCSVFFEEYVHDVLSDGTEYLQEDLNRVLGRIIPDQTELPPEGPYLYPGEEHFKAVASWPNAEDYLPGGDRSALANADAHLKATLIGSSATLEVEDGTLAVGKTGYVYFADFDRTRERDRKCSIIVIGE